MVEAEKNILKINLPDKFLKLEKIYEILDKNLKKELEEIIKEYINTLYEEFLFC